jgi:hypothetical protein
VSRWCLSGSEDRNARSSRFAFPRSITAILARELTHASRPQSIRQLDPKALIVASVAVCVRLADEAVDVWRPVQAEPLGDGRFRLLRAADPDPAERWEYPAGCIVLAVERTLRPAATLLATGSSRRIGIHRHPDMKIAGRPRVPVIADGIAPTIR